MPFAPGNPQGATAPPLAQGQAAQNKHKGSKKPPKAGKNKLEAVLAGLKAARPPMPGGGAPPGGGGPPGLPPGM